MNIHYLLLSLSVIFGIIPLISFTKIFDTILWPFKIITGLDNKIGEFISRSLFGFGLIYITYYGINWLHTI